MIEKSTTEGQTEKAEKSGPVTFAEFLEGVPPNQQREIADLASIRILTRGNVISGYSLSLATPDIHLQCSSKQCNGLRFFRSDSYENIPTPKSPQRTSFSPTYEQIVEYLRSFLRFALRIAAAKNEMGVRLNLENFRRLVLRHRSAS